MFNQILCNKYWSKSFFFESSQSYHFVKNEYENIYKPVLEVIEPALHRYTPLKLLSLTICENEIQ